MFRANKGNQQYSKSSFHRNDDTKFLHCALLLFKFFFLVLIFLHSFWWCYIKFQFHKLHLVKFLMLKNLMVLYWNVGKFGIMFLKTLHVIEPDGCRVGVFLHVHFREGKKKLPCNVISTATQSSVLTAFWNIFITNTLSYLILFILIGMILFFSVQAGTCFDLVIAPLHLHRSYFLQNIFYFFKGISVSHYQTGATYL